MHTQIDDQSNNISLGDKIISGLISFGLAVKHFLIGWIASNEGLDATLYMLFSFILTAAIGAFVGAAITFITRRFMIWLWKKLFGSKTESDESH